MLVLTRRVNQMIIITDPKTGDVFEVTVAGVHGGEVRVGVAAPKHITVDRSEIAESKRQSRSGSALVEAVATLS